MTPMHALIAFAVCAAFTINAQAQDKPAPPPAWKQGMAEKDKDSTLAPHAGKMTETAASDIPIDKLKAPPGFKVELWASGLPGGRAMALSDDGKKVYLGTRGIGRVYEVTDAGDKRTVRTVVDKLTQPAGVAYKNGALYVFAIDKVLKYDGIAGNPSVQPQDLTAAFESAAAAASQLEIHRLRPGRQAVRAVRLAVQYLRAPKGIRPDPALQRRRHGQGSHRHGSTQLGRLRLASADQGAMVH